MTPALVDHSRDHALATLGSQAGRAWALWHLLEQTDLPIISTWMIDAQLNGIAGVVHISTYFRAAIQEVAA